MRFTYQVCKSHDYSLDIRPDYPLDERRGILLQQNKSHSLHTTSIQACDEGCIRVRIHKRLIFYRAHEANAYKPISLVSQTD